LRTTSAVTDEDIKAVDALPFSVVRLGPASLHPLSLLYVLHGSAMISKTLRIPKP